MGDNLSSGFRNVPVRNRHRWAVSCPTRRPLTLRQGLTLVEVLVCLAVILVLAGVLYVASRGAVRSGHEVQVKSNLRQLALAVNLYRDAQGASCADQGVGEEMCLPPEAIDPLYTLKLNWPARSSIPMAAMILGPLGYARHAATSKGTMSADWWSSHAAKMQSRSIPYADFHLSPNAAQATMDGMNMQSGIGVRLDMTLDERTRRQRLFLPSFWE